MIKTKRTMIKTKCSDYGRWCHTCQERVNINGCHKCRKRFDHDETIFCESHSHTDSIHYCKDCKPGEQP